jgi:hypothetical protein
MLPGQGNCLVQGTVEISKINGRMMISRDKLKNQREKNVLQRHLFQNNLARSYMELKPRRHLKKPASKASLHLISSTTSK